MLVLVLVLLGAGRVCWGSSVSASQVGLGFWWGETTNTVPQKVLMEALFARCKMKVVDGLFRDAEVFPAEAGTPWWLVNIDITCAWSCGDPAPLVFVRLDPDDWAGSAPAAIRVAVAKLMEKLVGLPNLQPVDLAKRWAEVGGYAYWQKEEAWKTFLLSHSNFITKALWLDIRRLLPERVLVSPAHLQGVINSCIWRLVVFVLLFPIYIAIAFFLVWRALNSLWPGLWRRQ